MNRNQSSLGRLRVARGVSQQELADEIDVTVTHLCRVERGQAKPSAELARRLAPRLGLNQGRFWYLWKRMRRASIRAEIRN